MYQPIFMQRNKTLKNKESHTTPFRSHFEEKKRIKGLNFLIRIENTPWGLLLRFF